VNPAQTIVQAARILVVDDNPIIQRTLYFALRDQGHRVVLCGEITAALKVIREQPLELIVLDLNFPIDASTAANSMQDGFGVLGWIQHRPETRYTPVIVISNDPPEKSRARALACGAAAYLPKPVDKLELATTVARLLVRRAAELAGPTIA